MGVGHAKQEKDEMFSLRNGLLYLTNNGGRKEDNYELWPALFMAAVVSQKIYAILSSES